MIDTHFGYTTVGRDQNLNHDSFLQPPNGPVRPPPSAQHYMECAAGVVPGDHRLTPSLGGTDLFC